MKISHGWYFLLVLISLLFLASCSSTRLVTSWHDGTIPSGSFKKPLVVAIAKKQVIRAKLEDEFVRELRAAGVDAVQSYRMFSEEDLTAEMIRSKLPGTDRDSILVTHLVDVRRETVNVPPTTDVYPVAGSYARPGYYNNFGNYYEQGYSIVSSPGYSYDFKVYVLETNLYNAANEKLVCTQVTETEETGSVDAAVIEFVGVVVKGIKKDKVF